MYKIKRKGSLSPWNVKVNQFPTNGTLKSKMKFLIRYAILAPSGHNSQPWKFKILNKSLQIIPDYSRSRVQVDPLYRELFISLGAATKNLEVAAKYFGMMYEKSIEKGKIVFKFIDGTINSQDEEMFLAITNRRTNRSEFLEKPIEKEKSEKLCECEGEKTWVEMFDQKRERQRLANLIRDADLVWFKSKELTEELEGWLRDDIEASEDGLPTGVLNLYKVATEIKYLFSGDDSQAIKKAERDRMSALRAPILMAVVTKTDGIDNWIEAGEIYQLLALKLTNFGLENGFFNTVVELNGQRKKLADMFGIKGKVQLLLRIGYTERKEPAAPRRPLEEVLLPMVA